MPNDIEIVIKGRDQSQSALESAKLNTRKAASEMVAANLRVEKATAATTAAVEKFGSESLQARTAAQRLAAAHLKQEEAARKVDAAERAAAEAADKLAKKDRDAAESAQQLAAKQRDAAQATEHLTTQERQAADATQKLGKEERETGRDAQVAGEKTRAAARAADTHTASSHRLAGAMGAVGMAARSGLTVGLLAAAAAAAYTIKTGINYQQQLNMMQAVTHATGVEMQAVAKRARDLGNDLTLPATSAGDAAQAMTELAKGNLTAQQAMDAAKGTLQLAAAAQISGAEAAKIQADALGAFALKATAAGHVADVLANAANSATGEISDFAQGLAASSAVAHQFGLSVDDTVTALALFANAGIHGSDAGTSLKSALLALASPSNEAAKALGVLNLHAFDAKGRFVGLESIAKQLAAAQGKLSQETFAAATSTAFGSDAARAAGVLASAGAVGWEKMAAGISRSGGAADAAKAQMKGVGGALAGIKSQLETIAIDVFTAAAPSIERFLHAVADQIPKAIAALKAGFGAAAGPVTAFENGLRGVEDGLKPIGAILPGLNDGLKPIGALFVGLGAAGDGVAKGMAPVKAALAGVGAAGKGAADVFTTMGPIIGETATLMGEAVKPIGPLIKATGDSATRSGLERFFYAVGKAVADLIVFVRRNQDTWREWAGNVMDATKSVAGVIKDLVDFGHELAKYKGWIEPIAVGVGAAVVAFKAWAVATKGLAAAQVALDLALAANPVGAVVIAVVALTAAFIVAWKHSEKFRDVVKAVIPFLIPIVGLLIGPIVAIAAAFTVAWKQSERFRDVVVGVFRSAATVVLEAARFILDAVLGMVIGVLHAAGKMPGPLGAPFRAAEAAVRRFRDTADKQMAAAQARIDSWGRAAAKPVRKDITIRVIDRATGVMQSITRYADALSGRIVTVKVGAIRGAGAQIEGHGGIIGAATGGVQGGLRWVGEQGAELVRLPYGSTVYPHGQSVGMANASQAGGGGTVVIQVQPGGTGLDRLFVDWLRKSVRDLGGVDVVFTR